MPGFTYLQRSSDRLPWLRFALDVNTRFNELHGGYLAGAVTLAGFLSLFPLVLVASAVLGFMAGNSADLTRDLINSLGIASQGAAADSISEAIDTARGAKASASVLGLGGLLWAGLGLVAAIQYAYNSVWEVAGRGLKDRALGLMWLAGSGLLLLGSFAMTTAIQFLPGWLAPLNIGAALALSVGLLLWSGKVLANVDVGWAALLPGAIVGAVGLELLKLVGIIYVPRAVASSAVYGSVGIVFAILAWLFLYGRLLVYAQVINVVAWERSHGAVHMDREVPNAPNREEATVQTCDPEKVPTS